MNAGTKKTVMLDFSFLKNNALATVCTDAKTNARDNVEITNRKATAKTKMQIEMAENGGFVIYLKQEKK